MEQEPNRILVAMSGGVDSSVAAALLAKSGREVIGVFLRNGVAAAPGRSHRHGCCSVEDAQDARRVADRLQIPFYALDYQEAFSGLIQDFARAYAEGRTPNPCIECNRRFKMGSLTHLARQLGASAVATGHYARLVTQKGRRAVQAGRDRIKDQSYVLFALNQEQLAKTELPIGAYTKDEVRSLAKDFGLSVAEKAESMDICFVPTGDYRDVVRPLAPEAFEPGPIRTRDGRVLGQHRGTAEYTIGQRKGLPGGQGDPLFVLEISPERREVIVGTREETKRHRFRIGDLSFQAAAPLSPGQILGGLIQVRSHHRPVPAEIEVRGEGLAEVRSFAPIEAIAPGQAAVLYDEEGVVLMGGWILRDEDEWTL